MKQYLYIIAVILHTFLSCSVEVPESPEMLAIEGWIENDEAPVVFVTSAVSTTFKEKNIQDLLQHVALDAVVTVTHNGNQYRLTPTLRKEYLLQFCYTTNQIKGETGGTYRLDVNWKDMHAWAETTILEPGDIDSIAIERHPSDDTLYIVKTHVAPVPDVRYYRFFSMAVNKDPTYAASYMGVYDKELNNSEMIAVNRGITSPIDEPVYYYSLGDSVRFKLSSMDSIAYGLWSKFEENILFSHVALLPYSSNLMGNIHGGLGYWFGYGSRKYELKID